MLGKLRPRSVYDVMAAIACFGVLAGGTAYAANTIGSADIIDESILSQDIRNGQVTRGDIAANAVNSSRVADGALTGNDIAADTLTGNDIQESTLGQVPSAASAAASGLEIVNSNQVDNPAGTQRSGFVDCPAAKTPTGGGVYSVGGLGQNVNSSYPTISGWEAFVNNAAGAPDNCFFVYAVCVDRPATATRADAPEPPAKPEG